MSSEKKDHPELLTPAEVARIFHVDAKTVTRWGDMGRLASIRTLGGHRRFSRAEVDWALGGGDPAWDANPWCHVSPEPHPREDACAEWRKSAT